MILTQNSLCKNASKSTRLHLILHAGDCGCARVMWMSACQVIDVLYIAYGSGGSWVVSMFEHLSLEVCTCWRAHVNLNVCSRPSGCIDVAPCNMTKYLIKKENHHNVNIANFLLIRGCVSRTKSEEPQCSDMLQLQVLPCNNPELDMFLCS